MNWISKIKKTNYISNSSSILTTLRVIPIGCCIFGVSTIDSFILLSLFFLISCNSQSYKTKKNMFLNKLNVKSFSRHGCSLLPL